MEITRTVDLHQVLAFNGRGNVKVLEESNGGLEHRYTLLLGGVDTVSYTISPEPLTPGILERYRYYDEHFYVPSEILPQLKNLTPSLLRRYLGRKLSPHLHLEPGFDKKDTLLTFEPNPFNPDQEQIHIHQGVKVTFYPDGNVIQRIERAEKLPSLI